MNQAIQQAQLIIFSKGFLIALIVTYLVCVYFMIKEDIKIIEKMNQRRRNEEENKKAL